MSELAVGTRKGKSLISPTAPAKAKLMLPAKGDHVAVVSNDRHFLIFPLTQLPEMARGKGVMMQRSPRGLSDARVFSMSEGLSWPEASGRIRTVAGKDLRAGSASVPIGATCRRKGFRAATGFRNERLFRRADHSKRSQPLRPSRSWGVKRAL